MSDWMLYHVWRIRGYEVKHCERVEPNRLVVTIVAKPNALACPCCGSKDVIRKGINARLLRGTPVGRTHVHFAVHVPRVHCLQCGLTRQVRLPFADEKRRHTRQFERYALELAQLTTTAHAARHLGVVWDTVRDIESRYLGKHYRKPKLRHLKQLAIDEI